MKKRLLITSVVMMLVVAVALSTATYAWFTSNANVTASTISLTAATNTADALGIGWINGEAGTSISSNISATLAPMAPSTLQDGTTIAGATGESESSNIAFFTQTTKNENSVYVFNAAGTGVQPIYYNNGSVSAFYVKNLSNANSIDKITVEAKFTGDAKSYALTEDTTFDGSKTYYTKSASGDIYTAAEVTANAAVTADTYYEETVKANDSLDGNDLIRVAIFKKANSTGTSATNGYTLLGVLGQTATTYTPVTSGTFDKNTTYYTESSGVYSQAAITASSFVTNGTLYTAANTAAFGTIAANGAVKDLSHHAVATKLDLTTSLAAGDQVDIVAVVWLDGTMLDDSRQQDVGNVSLFFAAE